MQFGGPGLVFRSLDNTVNFLVAIRMDGSGMRRILETPIIGVSDVSPDGRWASVFSASSSDLEPAATIAVSLETGASYAAICPGCPVKWGADGKWLYLGLQGSDDARQSLAVPLGSSQQPPQALASLLPAAVKGAVPRGVRFISGYVGETLEPGRDPSYYAFVRRDMQRNLYRIPLH